MAYTLDALLLYEKILSLKPNQWLASTQREDGLPEIEVEINRYYMDEGQVTVSLGDERLIHQSGELVDIASIAAKYAPIETFLVTQSKPYDGPMFVVFDNPDDSIIINLENHKTRSPE